MIVYKDVLKRLKDAGYSTFVLRKQSLLSESALTNIRHNRSISFDNLNVICELLGCQIGDILTYVPDKKKKSIKKTDAAK